MLLSMKITCFGRSVEALPSAAENWDAGHADTGLHSLMRRLAWGARDLYPGLQWPSIFASALPKPTLCKAHPNNRRRVPEAKRPIAKLGFDHTGPHRAPITSTIIHVIVITAGAIVIIVLLLLRLIILIAVIINNNQSWVTMGAMILEKRSNQGATIMF